MILLIAAEDVRLYQGIFDFAFVWDRYLGGCFDKDVYQDWLRYCFSLKILFSVMTMNILDRIEEFLG